MRQPGVVSFTRRVNKPSDARNGHVISEGSNNTVEQNVLTRLDHAQAQIDPERTLLQAIAHHHAGQTTEAERLYRSIPTSNPTSAVASYSLGLLYYAQGRLQSALDAYDDALAVRPDYVDALINRGAVLLTLGRPAEAVSLYRQAIALSPGNAMALGNLGKALQDLGQVSEAIEAYRGALYHQPDNALVHANLGGALLEHSDWDGSEAATRRAIALDPANLLAHANLGTALLNLGRHDAALAACRQAVALKPHNATVLGSLGGAMLELGAWSEAEDLCHQAITLDPSLSTAHFNFSHALKALNRLDAATHAARQAIALRPDSPEYHFHLAHVLLLQGQMQEGWVEYEWRWQLPDFAWLTATHGTFPQPQWTGEDIANKTILIYTEQGLGDVIQFARYLPLMVRKAAKVIVAVHAPLRRLLETIAGLTIVPLHQTPLPPFDVHCPLLSLPRAFATSIGTIPVSIPYLQTDPTVRARWAKRIHGNKLRVGIVWAGNPATRRDRFRSPGFASIAPLFAVSGIDFVLLQVGPGRADLDAVQLPPNVIDLGREVTDLADTAAIMSSLDLMISSCTGPLHLAGALGVRTWAMIPFAPYFPWLLDRSDSPWYPSVRLYRQQQPGQDWSGTTGCIAGDLTAWARSGTSQTRPAPPPSVAIPDAGGFNEIALCRSGPMLFNRNDIHIGASLRKYGEFSNRETALFELLVRPGMTILDIGANIGVHTVDLSRLAGPAGVVHAFEPHRLIFQALCANMALNSRPNVFTHNVAVGATTGTLLMPAPNPSDYENYGGVSPGSAQRGDMVAMITIDDLDLNACHIIKLDVAGMETEALHGAAATAQRCRPILYVENSREPHSAELIALIQSLGYRLYRHLPPLYSAGNFRDDPENIFGDTVSVNMLCIPAEAAQSSLSVLREITSPTDQ
jgi:FkbM family methyltransferase